jgi:phage recombination protein Bet
MSNTNTLPVLWENQTTLLEIKKIFAPTLSELEFTTFTELGKFTGLNPFLREIWAVKYDSSKPAQIFIGRDGYRKSAQRHQQYDYHYCEAVYSNDDFFVEEGVYHHKFNLKDRGHPVGAFCNVYRKNSTRPFSVFVDIREYNKGQSVWKEKPATMIKKVAEAQCLRMAFQELFGGTYDESENWIIEAESSKDKQSPRTNIPIQIPQNNSTNSQVKNEPKLPTPPHFIDTPENRKVLFNIVCATAPSFNIDPQKDEEFIKKLCLSVLEKKPISSELAKIIDQTFDEALRVNEE